MTKFSEILQLSLIFETFLALYEFLGFGKILDIGTFAINVFGLASFYFCKWPNAVQII